MYVSQGSEFVSGRSQYLENTAYSGGGALYVSDANKVQIYGSSDFAVEAEYANNEIDSASVEKFKSPCYFSKNKAMSPNGEGGVGGAVCIDRKASIKILGCIAFKNVAGKAGGFISAKGKSYGKVQNVVLLNNNATDGGAMYAGDETALIITDTYFCL